jgi:hypothetical protein
MFYGAVVAALRVVETPWSVVETGWKEWKVVAGPSSELGGGLKFHHFLHMHAVVMVLGVGGG